MTSPGVAASLRRSASVCADPAQATQASAVAARLRAILAIMLSPRWYRLSELVNGNLMSQDRQQFRSDPTSALNEAAHDRAGPMRLQETTW
jgi:hypothetical protein